MAVLDADARAFWEENGYVIIPDAVPPALVEAAEQTVWDFLEMDANSPQSWYPEPPRKSIMVEIYQHPALWETRQFPRVHQAFTEIWGTEKLWVSFDRASMSPPNLAGTFERTNLGLHWDTSVQIPFRFHVQGVLYLTDTAANQGAFTCVPGFHRKIETWIKSLPEDAVPQQQNLEALGAVPVPGKAGDLIIWHSALPHSAGINTAEKPRVVQYISMSPTGEANQDARERRINAWKSRLAGFSGERTEKEHERGETAHLTTLGKKLLGLELWE